MILYAPTQGKIRTYVLSTIKSVCFQHGYIAKPSLMIKIWQLRMSFVFPASLWDVRWRVEANALWHADCNNDGKEENSKKQNKISILSAAAVSHLCLHAIYAVSDSDVFFFLFVFSGLRWYFCLAGDVSRSPRSATLWERQVSKKHESKNLWQMEKGVRCG